MTASGYGAGGGRCPAETWQESRACRWSWVDLYCAGDQVIYQGWWWEAKQRNAGLRPSLFGLGGEVWARLVRALEG